MPNFVNKITNTVSSAVSRLTDGLFGTQSSSFQGLGLNQSIPRPAKFAKAEEVFTDIGSSNILMNSTYQGSDVPSRRSFEYEKGFVTTEARKGIFVQLENLRSDDPMLSAGLYVLAQGAVGEGFSFSFEKPKEFDQTQTIGQSALEQADVKIKENYGSWCENWIFYGDGYYQIVADILGNFRTVEEMPAISMVRLSDHTDSFLDPQKAYKQEDALTRENEGYFSDYQLVHARYRRRNGAVYGSSIISPARQSSQDAIKGYAELIKRRRRSNPISTYLPLDGDGNPLVGESLRRFKNGEPGKPETALPEIRAERGDLSAVETDFPYRVVNGGKYQIETPNINLSEVGDLSALVDRELVMLGTPRGILTGDVVNFATLNALLKHLYAIQRVLARAFEYQVLRPIFNRVLLLAGILPEQIKYEINWGAKFTPEEMQFNAQLAINAFEKGVFDKLTTIEILCDALGRKDAQKIFDRVQGVNQPTIETPKTIFSFNETQKAGQDTVVQPQISHIGGSNNSNIYNKPNTEDHLPLTDEINSLINEMENIRKTLRKPA